MQTIVFYGIAQMFRQAGNKNIPRIILQKSNTRVSKVDTVIVSIKSTPTVRQTKGSTPGHRLVFKCKSLVTELVSHENTDLVESNTNFYFNAEL